MGWNIEKFWSSDVRDFDAQEVFVKCNGYQLPVVDTVMDRVAAHVERNDVVCLMTPILAAIKLRDSS
jgi:hypothetical protein